jgi:V-type H+-transporting ATPase subunit H
VDTMQSLLSLIGDALLGDSFVIRIHSSWEIVEDHDERIPLFLRTSESDPDLPYVPLLRWACLFAVHDDLKGL